MPWKESTITMNRLEFVERAKEAKVSFSALCAEFGISRKTGYKWIKIVKETGRLSDACKRPFNTPNKTDGNIESNILRLRNVHPAWGARKLHVVLSTSCVMPSVKTVNNILNRNGMIDAGEALKHKPYTRFERSNSNELWQADFKGDFGLKDGSRCVPLDIIDDHSRFAILVEPKSGMSGIKDSFERVFREYGLPKQILTDNGSCFRGLNRSYTGFERWLMEHDVQPIHGRTYHPQTQGKIERFHRTMKAEVLNGRTFEDLKEVRKVLKEWRREYNEVRPHAALNNKTPSQAYEPSERIYNEKIPRYEYEHYEHKIKVNSWGYLRYMNFQTYFSEVFANTYLALRASESEGKYEIIYRNYRIAEIDMRTQKILNKTIVRL